MDNWLGRISRHPTGAQIIGGLAVVAIAAAIAKWWDPIVSALGEAWYWPAALGHNVGDWFTANVTLPRYHLIGLLLLVAFVTGLFFSHI
jgi:hypothetical protein